MAMVFVSMAQEANKNIQKALNIKQVSAKFANARLKGIFGA
jgi:hypothetical protein